MDVCVHEAVHTLAMILMWRPGMPNNSRMVAAHAKLQDKVIISNVSIKRATYERKFSA